jgi:hypothetical protein
MVAWIGCYLQQADKLSTSSRDQAGVFHPNKSYIQTMEARCREVWTSEFLQLKPKRALIKDSNDTFLRDLMGLLMDTEADELLAPCQGMGRRTRVSIESMEEKAAYIPWVRGLGRDA